jgi:hypothetical protein
LDNYLTKYQKSACERKSYAPNRLGVLNILDQYRLSAESALILSVSCDRFALALFDRRFKVSVLTHIRKNPRFGDFTLESA